MECYRTYGKFTLLGGSAALDMQYLVPFYEDDLHPEQSSLIFTR